MKELLRERGVADLDSILASARSDSGRRQEVEKYVAPLRSATADENEITIRLPELINKFLGKNLA